MDMTQMTREQLLARNAELEARKTLRLGVSPKGCVMVLGLRGFPVSLYPGEWTRLLEMSDEITEFIETHRDQLSWK